MSAIDVKRCDDCGSAIGIEWSDQFQTYLCLTHFQRRAEKSGAPVVTDDEIASEAPSADLAEHYHDGTIVWSAAHYVKPVWGEGNEVVWAEGEPLAIVGGDGTGKTMLGQQLALYRAGIRKGSFLGYPVTPGVGRTLYIAADRPAQALRSMRRMVTDDDKLAMGARLGIWQGPLPFDLVREPKRLASWVAGFGCDGAIVDCLKDIAPSLSAEETGFAISVAMQACMVAGIQLVVLHHQRKAQGENKRPNTLSDVYGSRLLTASCGSVVMLWGEAGDPIVEFLHLKQPGETIGPLTLLYNTHNGTATVQDAPDTFGIIVGLGNSATVMQVAQHRFGVRKPKPALIERARRQLDAEVRSGRLCKLDPEPGEAAVYAVAGGSRESDSEGVTRVTPQTDLPLLSKGVGSSHEPTRPDDAPLSLIAVEEDEAPARDFASWEPYRSRRVEDEDEPEPEDWP